ncbi:reverse transcriptase [Phytophthora megakarya]|uniref:Reverse transcriptase n=1 Tax=Phytophthora megakarya TaxID=4795 RepID=A0A225VTA1_9STRA|nr:reverse transcriptase [Phytophthora megakarya]
MSDVFMSFNKILGQRQRATMAYRPQANGFGERMDLDQSDWDEYAERLTFVINTARDRVQGETPFYMIHGWDPRSTLEAVIPVGSTHRHDRDPRRWQYQMQKYYQQVREQVNQRLREAIADRADTHNDLERLHTVGAGSRVWLYLYRVREGYANKLAHLWHEPFRVAENEVGDSWVNVQHLSGGTWFEDQTGQDFPDQPVARLEESDADRIDFDEALLPEGSWIQDRHPNEYEVDRIPDMRTGPTWVDEADLNCGAFLYAFMQYRTNRNRFGVMQSHENREIWIHTDESVIGVVEGRWIC